MQRRSHFETRRRGKCHYDTLTSFWDQKIHRSFRSKWYRWTLLMVTPLGFTSKTILENKVLFPAPGSWSSKRDRWDFMEISSYVTDMTLTFWQVVTNADAQESIKLSSVTITSIDDPDIIKQGYLLKVFSRHFHIQILKFPQFFSRCRAITDCSQRGGLRRNWKSRFFILTPVGLTYYHSQHSGKIPKGHINLGEDKANIRLEKVEVMDKMGPSKNVFLLKVIFVVVCRHGCSVSICT